jgi:cysteine desulfurase
MIYLDHNATTPVRPQVIDLVTKIMGEVGNGSSTHHAGRVASMHIERAREQMARAVNTRPAQVIFTSCATESMNTILKTFKGERILASAIEHAVILDCGHAEVEIIPVTTDGVIDLNAMEDMLKRASTALVNIMYVNNETGVIQPVADAVKLAHQYDALIHIDAVQALGKIPVDFTELGADYMSFSAHKIGGPQGVGCFVFGAKKPIRPLLVGGKQEKRQRAGTSNIAGIAGMGLAAELAVENMGIYDDLAVIRDEVESRLTQSIPNAYINGQNAPRVGNTISLTCNTVTNTVQMMNLDLDKICVSGGSACSSGVAKPSHVLKAMGVSDNDALATLRISMGWDTTRDDMIQFMDKYTEIIGRLDKST